MYYVWHHDDGKYSEVTTTNQQGAHKVQGEQGTRVYKVQGV